MTWVKICGVTHESHVDAAVEGGADAIGLVCWPGSPRNIEPGDAAGLVAHATVPVYLLTVDMASSTTLGLAERLGVSGIQPYGVEAPVTAVMGASAGLDVITPTTPEAVPSIPAGQRPLVDSGSAKRPGGTGIVRDWPTIPQLEGEWILAGGLTPDNVNQAISQTGAWGVDASSGLEVERGVKSPALIERFLREVKGQ
ncbi:MAG: phosphoribosylanthranilate isomerase [Acidimicrobiia bacterium]|nr:phosphoribosylanthranilate isomerase [Acidimicrobiia bacterium]